MRRLIINADDFGLSPGINRGILHCFGEGVLTSTTMMVNMGHFGDAVRIARANPDLPVGIHMTLLWGRPVLAPDRVPSLVMPGGGFPRGLATLARRYVLGRLSGAEVREEFRAQVRRFLDSGLRPTHLDTHKHIHCLPGVLRALIEVAQEFDITRIRLPVEWPLASEGRTRVPASRRGDAKRRLIRLLARNGRNSLKSAGIRTTDHFAGIWYMSRLDAETLRVLLGGLREGVTELMCHPGYIDAELGDYAGAPPHREREIEGLTAGSTKEMIKSSSIELINFGEL